MGTLSEAQIGPWPDAEISSRIVAVMIFKWTPVARRGFHQEKQLTQARRMTKEMY